MTRERIWVFSYLDLIAPWGVALAAAALCAYAAIHGVADGNPIAAKVVSIATGIVFLAMVPLWYFIRSKLRKYDYKTRHGLYVVLGKTNTPDQSMVEMWTAEVIAHWVGNTWTNSRGIQTLMSGAKVDSAVQGLTVFFRDEEKLSIWGRFVRGYSTDLDLTVGWNKNPDYVHGLFRHELSHPILNAAGEPWNEDWHHQVFQQTKLGA